MGNFNPIALVRDVDSSPNCSRQVHEIVGRVVGSGAGGVVTVETRLKSILAAVVINETDGAVVVPTIAASAVAGLTNTYKVTFTAVTAKTYSYFIVGLLDKTMVIDTITTATTVNYYPLGGNK